MAQSKSTRKFEKNHLKDTIKRRKDFAKIKQRHQVNAKRKLKKAAENERDEDHPDEKKQKPKDDAGDFETMNVDDFFQGGFDIPEAPVSKKGKKDDSKTLKRKRTEGAKSSKAPEGSADEDSDDSAEAVPVGGAEGDEESDSESENDPETYKAQLEALAEKDPEFHKYLQENDAELLAFEDADLAEIDELSGSDVEEGPKKKKQKKQKKAAKVEVEAEGDESSDEEQTTGGNEVTRAMIKKWGKAMVEQHSLRATREVVLAFRAAAHVSDDDDKEYKYAISNPDAYHELLVIALKHVPDVLQHHLPVKERANGKVSVSTDSKKYRSLSPLLKSHITSLIHLLTHLSDAATQRLTLSSIAPLLPYILSFKKVVRDLVRTITEIWSNSSNTESSRIASFLVLRRLTVIGDPGIREAVLKTVYQGLLKGSRNTTVHTLGGINLMKNSAAELWGIDATIGYTTGFTFIRQLAIHLRSSITNNSKESYKSVYNWQYIHSLDFWSRVLATHCSSLTEATKGAESPLRPLIYPTVQVTLGAMRLIPTSTYFPLRFHLVRALLRVSLATGTYIPLGAALYEVLNSAEMRKPPKPSTNKPLDFAVAVRAPKSYLRTRVYQDGVGEQVVELFGEFFVLWARSIAFPELALPVLVLLRRWLKDVGPRSKAPNQNAKLSGAMQLLLQKIEANVKFVEEKRQKVDFAPNNRAGVEGFLKETEWQKTPLGAFIVGQRKTREEKQRILDESRKDDEKRKEEERAEKKKNGYVAGPEEDEDASEEEEEEDVDEDSE